MKKMLSYSCAKKLLRLLPEEAVYQIDGPRSEPTPAMLLGTNVERAFCEGLQIFSVYPGKTRRGKEWDKFKAENDNIIKQSELEKIACMVRSLDREAGWLKEMDQQKHCEKEFEGITLHGYTDFENDDSVFDLKKTDPTPHKFRKSIGEFDYHVQAAIYNYCTGKAFYWICVAENAPYAVRCYKASPSTIEAGMYDLRRAVELFKRYQAGTLIQQQQDAIEMDPPNYVLDRLDA